MLKPHYHLKRTQFLYNKYATFTNMDKAYFSAFDHHPAQNKNADNKQASTISPNPHWRLTSYPYQFGQIPLSAFK